MHSNRLFRNILEYQLKEIRRNTYKLFYRYNAECVHDLRVTALRTDFVLKFFSSTSLDKIQKIRNQLKETRRIMGDARNLDILLSHTKQNLKKGHVRPSQRKDIISSIESRRKESHRALIKVLRSSSHTAVLKELKGIKDHHRVPGLRSVIKSQFRKAIFDLLDYRKEKVNSDNFHKIRIAFKKLRYACEFLENVDKPRMQKTMEFIKKFQDLLGDRQDSIACIEILSGFTQDNVEKLIEIEKYHIKNCQKKFKKLWGRSFLKHSMIVRLYRWSRRPTTISDLCAVDHISFSIPKGIIRHYER